MFCSIRKRVCNQIEQRASYAVPLEIIYMTPLSKWNPYNLQYKGEAGSVMGKTVNADGRTGGTEPEKAYNGINSKVNVLRNPGKKCNCYLAVTKRSKRMWLGQSWRLTWYFFRYKHSINFLFVVKAFKVYAPYNSYISKCIQFQIFYQTPNELFAGAGSGGDSADTVRRFGVGVLDTAGQVKLVRASGTRIFLPDIAGVGHIRQRWPIMPAHDQGSGVWKELEALKDIVLKSQRYLIRKVIKRSVWMPNECHQLFKILTGFWKVDSCDDMVPSWE